MLKDGWLKVGISFAFLSAYVFLMKYFGYLVVTPVALFAFSTLFAKGGNIRSNLLYRILFFLGFFDRNIRSVCLRIQFNAPKRATLRLGGS